MLYFFAFRYGRYIGALIAVCSWVDLRFFYSAVVPAGLIRIYLPALSFAHHLDVIFYQLKIPPESIHTSGWLFLLLVGLFSFTWRIGGSSSWLYCSTRSYLRLAHVELFLSERDLETQVFITKDEEESLALRGRIQALR